MRKIAVIDFEVMVNLDLTLNQYLVWEHINWRQHASDSDGWCRDSMRQFQEHTIFSKSVIHRIINELFDKNLIDCIELPNGKSAYKTIGWVEHHDSQLSRSETEASTNGTKVSRSGTEVSTTGTEVSRSGTAFNGKGRVKEDIKEERSKNTTTVIDKNLFEENESRESFRKKLPKKVTPDAVKAWFITEMLHWHSVEANNDKFVNEWVSNFIERFNGKLWARGVTNWVQRERDPKRFQEAKKEEYWPYAFAKPEK